MNKCIDCSNNVSIHRGRESIFCNECIRKHRKDIVEIISDDNIKIYSAKEHEEAFNAISKKNVSKKNISLRLDFHGVLDTISSTIKLTNLGLGIDICVISYVGKFSQMRVHVRNEIKERIKSGQIKFGILVFKRRRGEIYTKPGSKAWTNLALSQNKLSAYFIDDSIDHIESTNSLNIQNLTCIQMMKGDNLIALIHDLNLLDLSGGGYYKKYIKYKTKYLNAKIEYWIKDIY